MRARVGLGGAVQAPEDDRREAEREDREDRESHEVAAAEEGRGPRRRPGAGEVDVRGALELRGKLEHGGFLSDLCSSINREARCAVQTKAAGRAGPGRRVAAARSLDPERVGGREFCLTLFCCRA